MLSTDLVGDLRAEVTRWWETTQKAQQAARVATPTPGPSQASPGPRGMLTPILGAMLGDGPIRMITLGQELTVDIDDKLLVETQFKDNQVCNQISLASLYSHDNKPRIVVSCP